MRDRMKVYDDSLTKEQLIAEILENHDYAVGYLHPGPEEIRIIGVVDPGRLKVLRRSGPSLCSEMSTIFVHQIHRPASARHEAVDVTIGRHMLRALAFEEGYAVEGEQAALVWLASLWTGASVIQEEDKR